MASYLSGIEFFPVTEFTQPQIKKFDSGDAELNLYFYRFAKKNSKSGLSPCSVMIHKDNPQQILGYVTVSNSSIKKGNPPFPTFDSFPNYPVPVTLLGRFAIYKPMQGKGLGQFFLMHIFFNFYRAVEELRISSVGIIADAVNSNAVSFYQKHDFKLLPGQHSFPKRMFIAKGTIFDSVMPSKT